MEPEWKQFVRREGVAKIAGGLNVTRQTVYNLLADKTAVTDKLKRGLIDLSGGEFGVMSFYKKA